MNDQTLSPANALHLFRIMQEAVNNALRHSKCKNILVEISSIESWEIRINDDGKGIPGFGETLFSGNGLKNIKLRCEEAGWKVEWKNAIPNGTDLFIRTVLI